MLYGNKIQKLSYQDKSGKQHCDIIFVDSAVFPQSLWGSKQEEPFGVQRLSGRELQTTDSKSSIAGYQQVS